MADAPYSNRELDRIFKSHEEKMMAGFEAVMEKVADLNTVVFALKEQVTIANGRTKKLEDWRENMRGAWKLVTWIGIPLFAVWVGFVSWSTTELLKLKESVQNTPQLVEQAIANELETYVFEVTQ
jgi:hypothetical protein